MVDQDRLLDRVRKLLAQAEDPAVTPAEAEVFNEKAAALIAQYGIDQALLAQRGAVADVISSVRVTVDNPYASDKGGLLNHIAQALRCRTVLHSFGRSLGAVTVFGFASDLDRVQLLYTSLLLQATTQVTRVRPDRGESVAAYRRSWLAGFSAAVYRRLLAAEQRATAQADTRMSAGSTALVLVDRKARVDAAFADTFTGLRKAARRRLSGYGHGDGYRAGQTADLGTTALGRQRAAIGGGR